MAMRGVGMAAGRQVRSGYYSNAKIRFQSFFMLMTVQLPFCASPHGHPTVSS